MSSEAESSVHSEDHADRANDPRHLHNDRAGQRLSIQHRGRGNNAGPSQNVEHSSARLGEAQRTKVDYEHNITHPFLVPTLNTSGVEVNERVRLPTGEIKPMGEIRVGDYLLNGIGIMRYVSSVNRNFGDAYEITNNSIARTFDIHSRQRAIVGAQQKLDVFISGVHVQPEAWHMVMYELSGDGAIPDHENIVRNYSSKMRKGRSKITMTVGVIS